MRVLVTGSAGFIGSAVADALTARGDEPVRVDAMLPQAHGAVSAPPDTHRLDVRDVGEWRHLLDGVDAVCHQSALVGAGVRVADLPDYAA
ncbi:MAG: NAD-dependent epimerase/dehydratase family protein, partial [Nocardioides sp.]